MLQRGASCRPDRPTPTRPARFLALFPTDPPTIFYGGDSDRRLPAEQAPWDGSGSFWEGTCGTSEAAVGLSQSSDRTFTHALLCKNVGAGASGTQTAVLTFDREHADDHRNYRRISDWEWRSGWELECGLHEYVSGISQEPSNGSPLKFFHGVRCSAGLGSASGCEARLIQNDKGKSGDWGDWDYSYFKADCPTGKVMVGLSTDGARPVSIFCCDQGTTARYEAESAGLVRYVSLVDAKATNGVCVRSTTTVANRAKVTWTAVSSTAATSRTLEFGVRSPNGTTRTMGVWVNGTKRGTISTKNEEWENQGLVVPMGAGNNTVELRDSEGTSQPDVDYVQITVP